MAKPKIRLHDRGMQQLLDSDGVSKHMLERARRVADTARATAPVASGDYRAGLQAWTAQTDRAVARAGSDVDHAVYVEAKTGNLNRALDAAS